MPIAQMYEAYNRTIEPVTGFIPVGQLTAARTANGSVIFNVPLDYLPWTKNFAAVASIVTQNVSLMEDVTERHLWVTGTVTAMAKDSLGKMGWTVHEQAGKQLGLPAY